MIAQGDPSSDMADIFRRSEFQRTPSWWDRLWSAVGDAFDHLSFSWLGTAGQFVLWILLIIAALALGSWLWRRWRSRSRRDRERTPEDDVVPIAVDSITDPDELRDAHAAFARERDYQQAILFRYRELVAVLMRERLVTNQAGRTTGELRVDLRASSSTAAPAFDAATTIFEVAWFSDHPATPEEFDDLDRLATETLALVGMAASASEQAHR